MNRLLVGVAVAVLAVGYLAVIEPSGLFDLRADRLTAQAAVDGVDPYVPVRELAERYASTLGWAHVHPRTPGALVLQLPLVLVPEGKLQYVSAIGTALALVAAVSIALRHVQPRPWVGGVAMVLVGVSTVAVESAAVGAQSPVVALLLAWAWWRLRDGDDIPGGVSLGLAITLKIFPWVLVPLAVFTRRKASLTAVGTAAVLNLAGLAFAGVDLGGAVRAVSSANLSEAAELNASLSRFTGGVIGVEALTIVLAVAAFALAVVIGLRIPDHDRRWHAMVAVAVVASPLVWRHYLLVLVPALVWLAARSPRGLIVAGTGAVWLLAPWPLVTVWFAIPLCALVAVAVLSEAPQQEPSR